MRIFNRSTPTGWKPVVLLFVLAVSLLVVSYRIDREESRRSHNPSGGHVPSSNTPPSAAPPADPAAEAATHPEDSARGQPPEVSTGLERGAGPGPSFSVPDTLAGESPRPGNEPSKATAFETGGVARSQPPNPMHSTPESTVDLAEQLGRPVSYLHGQVLNSGGDPVFGARVRLGNRSVKTNSQGEFTIPRGTDELVVEHPDYFGREVTAAERRALLDPIPNRDDPDDSVAEGASTRPLRILLFPGSRIRGQIHDERDAPISGVNIQFSPVEGGIDLAARPGSVVRSIGDGSYESPLLHPGAYHVLFRHPNFQPRTDVVTVSPRQAAVVFDATLAPGEKLQLTLRGSKDEPLADARVWLDRRREGESAEETLFLGVTDELGQLHARRESNSPGGFVQHWVRIHLAGYREVRRAVKGPDLLVTMTPAPCLDGIGIDETEGLPQTIRHLRLEMETPEGYRRVAEEGILLHSLPLGRFRIGLPDLPGTYRVRVEAEGRLVGTSDPLVFDGQTSPAQFTVRLRPRGGIQGVVMADQATVANVLVELHRNLPAPRRLFYGIRLPTPSSPYRVTRTDSRGHFEFDDIEPGTYRLHTVSPNHASVYSAPVVSPASESIPLPLDSGAALHGRVLDSEGKPEFGVPLVLVCLDRPFPIFATSDQTGAYRFANLADGRYVLIPGGDATFGGASIFSWDSVESEVSNTRLNRQVISVAGRGDVTFDLHLASFPWGSVEGLVLVDNEVLADREVRIVPVNGSNGRVSEARTDASGRFRAHGLSPGLYRLQSVYPPFNRETRIEAGKRVSERIELASHLLTIEVVHARTGRRVPTTVHARVARLSPGNPSASRITHRARSRLGQDKPLVLEKLHPGLYQVEVRAAGFLPETRRFEMASGPARIGVSLRPGIPVRVTVPSRSLDGRVQGSTPLRGHGKITVSRNGVEAYRFEGYVDGEILLPELAPGVYQMAVESGGETVRSSFKILP